MAITPNPKSEVPSRNLSEFISGAPDSAVRRSRQPAKGVFRGTRRQITITLPPDLLEKVDRVARGVGQTRTSFINTCLWRAVEYGISIDGLGRRGDRD